MAATYHMNAVMLLPRKRKIVSNTIIFLYGSIHEAPEKYNFLINPFSFQLVFRYTNNYLLILQKNLSSSGDLKENTIQNDFQLNIFEDS